MASDCKHDGLIWNGLCAECGADVSAMVPAAQQQQELVPLIGAGVHHKGLMAHRQVRLPAQQHTCLVCIPSYFFPSSPFIIYLLSLLFSLADHFPPCFLTTENPGASPTWIMAYVADFIALCLCLSNFFLFNSKRKTWLRTPLSA